jgi:L-alanine-DL-glutamate epimerase-like enolase superfamily enzyme
MVLRWGPIDASRPDGTQDAFLVRLHTDEGLVGIGEADTSPDVAYTIIDMPSSHAVARGLAELIVGEDPLQIRRLWDAMFVGSYHYGRDGAALHAISAIDMALWDLAGKAAGRPICDLLGGGRAEYVNVYASEVMPETAEDVAELAGRVTREGFGALKLGWGPLGTDLGRDIDLISAAREAIGPDRRLMVDGGMAYSVKKARQLCRCCESLDLSWFEEPFDADDMSSYRRLSDTVAVRIACGEAHSTLRSFKRLIDEGRVDVLQPDLGRCGGITVAAEVARLASADNVDVVPHSFSTDVLLAASLQFVASLGGERLVEYPVTASIRSGSIVAEPFLPRDGLLAVPRGPGLGIELNDDEVARRRVR